MATKRSLDMERQKAKVEAASLSSTLDPDSKENVLECRVLIENNQVGGIIGKGGANVRKVRSDTGAAVSILKPEFRDVKERIMVIKGTISQISKALGGIAQLVVDTLKSREKKTGATDGGDQAQLRILVHKFAVGAIIGKGGATIRDIQQETTTRIQVANEPQPSSTEKTVTITGNPEAIENAAFRVLTRLEENPLRSGTTTYYYVPGQLSHYYSAPPPYSASPPSLVYGSPAPPPLYPYGTVSSPPQRLTNKKMTIPTAAAGAVIGRGGSVIRDIRAQSGTTISIADPDSASPTERVITITGTSQGIQSAVYMIRQLLDQYQHSLQY